MNTLVLTPQGDNVVVGGSSFDFKEIIRCAGARWNPVIRAWVFHKSTVADITELISPAVNDLAAFLAAEKIKQKAAAKAHKKWLQTPEGQAHTVAAEKARVALAVSQGSSWICCKECTVVDWVRQHTFCKACAEDGNSFRVRGMIRTGD
jgi:hypothetical protein